MNIRIPIIEQFQSYSRQKFAGDLMGGLTVGVMLIPQGMAYAFLAGIPAVYGLYASLVPLFIYMVLGTSKFVTIGPAALISLLIISSLNQLNISDPDVYLNAVFVIALMAGAFQILLGALKLGNIINFISQPVLKGFIMGAALTIMLSQLKHILGLPIEGSETIDVLFETSLNILDFNWLTLAIGVGGIVFLLLLKPLGKRIPAQLLLVLLTLGAAWYFQLYQSGVQILGEVPSGIPDIVVPQFSWELMKDLIPVSVTIGLISFIEIYAIGASLEEKEDQDMINPNQELIAAGLGKTLGAFFQAFPTSGSFSRSAVNKDSGTRTNIAGIFTIALVVLTLLYFTPYFYHLPKATLGAIIIVAITGLFDFPYIKQLARIDRRDLLMLIITAGVTFLIGVQEGILTGVILSVVSLVYNTSYPHIVEIGLVKGTDNTLRNVDRFSDAQVDDHILIVRIDAPLTFANVPQLTSKLNQFERRKKDLSFVLLNATAIDYVDSTAIETIKELAHTYEKKKVRFAIAGLKGPVRDKFERCDMFAHLGRENFYVSDIEALRAYKHGRENDNTDILFQSNH